MNRYLIGIDTGGTFTDGVLLNYATREVVSTAKSLTTRKDLKQGVIKVLQKLHIPQDGNIKLVGISSTLATNSIAENKARKVALLLIGYKKALVENYGLQEDFATDDMHFIKGGHDAQGDELAPLDKEAVKNWIRKKKKQVDAVAVSAYFSPLNPRHEKEAFEIIKAESDLPVIMGHQLSTRLNSVKRAATASINASLVAVMKDFLQSVRKALQALKVDAPLMIVRGDGTLMPYEEAVKKPVETVLSGPAASAIGGRFLSGKKRSLVIDMGSTTTDMALVEDNRVVVSPKGARVGKTETAIEAAQIRTISLGCDSRIAMDSNYELVIGPDRVRALSQISAYHEEVAKTLHEIKKNDFANLQSIHDLEFWYLHQRMDNYTANTLNQRQKAILDTLHQPRQLSDLMREFQVYHPQQLEMHELIQAGYIECATLNATDLLHANGAIELWDAESATIATKSFCKRYGLKKPQFIEQVFTKIIEQLVEEVLIFLAYKDVNKEQMPGRIDGKWGKWMLQEFLHHHSELLFLDVSSKVPIIGSGAPARHFLKEVARLANTKLFLPKYTEVANAIGAVSGSVTETREAIVFIRENKDNYGYQVKYNDKRETFDTYKEACQAASDKAYALAQQATLDAGGIDPYTEVESRREGSLTRFIARSAGSPKLSDNFQPQEA